MERDQFGIRGGNSIYLLRTREDEGGNLVVGAGKESDLATVARDLGLEPHGEAIGLHRFGSTIRAFQFPGTRGFYDFSNFITPVGEKALQVMKESPTPLVEGIAVEAYNFLEFPESRQPYGWVALIRHPEDDVETMVSGSQEFLEGTYKSRTNPGYAPPTTGPIGNRICGGYGGLPEGTRIRKGVLVPPSTLERIERTGVSHRHR